MKRLGCGMLMFFLQNPCVLQASVSSAFFQVSGVVAEVLELKTASLARDLDLWPGQNVNSIKIGSVNFRLNTDVAQISISSSTASGAPENSKLEPYQFSKPFSVKINGHCQTLNASASKKPIVLDQEGVNLKSNRVLQLKPASTYEGGLDEVCELGASWETSSTASLSRINSLNEYSMSVIISIVSL